MGSSLEQASYEGIVFPEGPWKRFKTFVVRTLFLQEEDVWEEVDTGFRGQRRASPHVGVVGYVPLGRLTEVSDVVPTGHALGCRPAVTMDHARAQAVRRVSGADIRRTDAGREVNVVIDVGQLEVHPPGNLRFFVEIREGNGKNLWASIQGIVVM